jgi:site-specific DNA recombinase
MKSPRVGVYARISSDDGTALGVARQLEDCTALAEARGWTVAQPFVDNDVSASTGKRRPEYERLLDAIRQGEIAGLVVWDIDRLTRTPAELEEFISLADAHKISLASVGGEVDLGTPQGRLTARIKGNVAKHEVEQSSRRLKRKFQERAEAGKPHGKVAYGYRRVPIVDDDGKAIGSKDVLHEEQAAVIRDVATRILNRESIWGIVNDLNAREIASPRGREWNSAVLRQVMLRQRNAGRRVHQGKVIGKGDWEPILSEDQFDQLVALLTDPSRRTARGNQVVHLLSGIARCGRQGCGGVLRVVSEKTHAGRTSPAAYSCRSCFRLRRKQSDVDELVERVIVARLSQPDGPDLLGGNAEEARLALEEAAGIEARLNLAADEYAEGALTGEQLKRITAKLRPRLDEARAKAQASAPAPELARFGGPDMELAWISATLDVKRAIIMMLAEITIAPAGSGSRFDPASVRIRWRGAGS